MKCCYIDSWNSCGRPVHSENYIELSDVEVNNVYKIHSPSLMATTWVLGTKIDIHEVDARLTSIFCVEVFAGSGWLKDHCIPQEVRGSLHPLAKYHNLSITISRLNSLIV